MPDLIHVQYATTGESTSTDAMGMREMQARAYTARAAQYLLLKAPPASGKSRALMFIALDKLHHQGLKKAIIAVPERSIGGSFDSTQLSKHGFFTDWTVPPEHNLCTPGGDKGKVGVFKKFLEGDGRILICTHATLRFAFDELNAAAFNGCLLAVDEFHHVSGNEDSRLGELVRSIMSNSTAHLVAMTGSYFRGDSQPVLLPEDEAKFTGVTYNYYEQLNGYEHLKSLGIGYHFYQGRYMTAIGEVLDTNQKTILHIPHVRTGESTKDKHGEVGAILDLIGEVVSADPETGVLNVKRKSDGKMIKVADLVDDDEQRRSRVIGYLRKLEKPEDMDLIIALGMAKEGFDWKFCEHALTVGYRGSLTEVIQIIGRCTRDSVGKKHAQFTNLIAQPDAKQPDVALSVNNMLKAITCSLLMEQVLAPVIKFKPKQDGEDTPKGEIRIKGLKGATTDRVKKIIEQDINDLKAAILGDDAVTKAIAGTIDPEVLNKVLIPKVIETKYPQLTAEEKEQVRQHVVVGSVIAGGEIVHEGDKRFIRMAGQFINIDDLSIDLIDSINPFQRAYEILSKQVDVPTLKAIQDCIAATRIQMTDDEAILLFPKIKAFVQTHQREPNINALDPLEQRMASALIFIKKQRQQRGQ
ncbi:MAG: DEAD/DEAH box helicase family protein [Prosthecobacter sp.]|uniref:DEAD/DEAH box helicase n=1 Tax=Prosthecobacter sp. TaxID=1965333 RepID=UPI0019FB42E4|nr:DEAD/DEAH box helicase [Prosthecobacter sp.]MBE2285301.1 DEAD/DEAH box helicase family protein [Prosthecobacter sp.]